MRSSDNHLRAISQEKPQPSITKVSLKITYLKFHSNPPLSPLTHWGQVTHICINKLTIIVSDNGLSPGQRQAIIWTNAGILLIGSLGTNVSEILSEIQTFSFKKMHLKTSFAKWWPLCLSLNVLIGHVTRWPLLGLLWYASTWYKILDFSGVMNGE